MQFELDILESMAWDNLQAVTYVSRRDGADMVAVVENVKGHQVSVREAATSFGAYQAGDWRANITRRHLPANIDDPKPGDYVVTADDQRWTVLTVDHRRRDKNGTQLFGVNARNLAVYYDLRDLITVQMPEMTLDAAGAMQKTWKAKYVNISAKVQKISETVAEERAIRGLKGTYQVFVDRELHLSNQERIAWTPKERGVDQPHASAPRFLEIVGYHNAERIDEIPVIDAEAAV